MTSKNLSLNLIKAIARAVNKAHDLQDQNRLYVLRQLLAIARDSAFAMHRAERDEDMNAYLTAVSSLLFVADIFCNGIASDAETNH